MSPYRRHKKIIKDAQVISLSLTSQTRRYRHSIFLVTNMIDFVEVKNTSALLGHFFFFFFFFFLSSPREREKREIVEEMNERDRRERGT